MSKRRLFGCALFISTLAAGALAQHNVPANQQDGLADCGPAAAASCLKWFQQNGFPDLKDPNGNNGVKDFEKQLEKDAGTDENGTWNDKLRDAMNKLVDGTPHKGQLRAKLAPASAYKSFTFLDEEFSHDENILLTLKWKDADGVERQHYVTVKNITGQGNRRTVEYMDPNSGTFKTGNMSVQNNVLHMMHDGVSTTVDGILTMSPANTTASTSATDPNNPATTIITYTSYYPSFRPTKDLHVWVSDRTKANYTVTGLPDGWSWDIKQEGNRCYLSIWKGDGAGELANGATITVRYTGSKKVKETSGVITPTTGGTSAITDGAQAPGRGHTVMAVVPENPPDRPASCALGLLGAFPDGLAAIVAWAPVTDEFFSHYEVYDVNSGELFAESTVPELLLPELGPDELHQFVIAARNMDVALGDESASVGVHLDARNAIPLIPGPPLELSYVSPLYSGDAPAPWTIALPGVLAPGKLYVVTLLGAPLAAPPGDLGAPHSRYYHLLADAPLTPGPISVAVPYHTPDVEGDESGIRLLARVGDAWVDVTTGVDPTRNLVFGTLPALGTLLIVNPPAAVIPAISTPGVFALLLLLAAAGALVMRRHGPQAA